MKRAVVEQARSFGANKVLVEDASSGQALLQDLRNDGFYLVEAVKPKGDKSIRLNSVTPPIENGLVFVPTNAPWLEDYLHELMMFPAARYDDQVDSTSQALANAFIFRSDGEGWMEFIRQELKAMREGDTPSIRVNCDDRGMQFHLITGRRPRREADGTFFMTAEEAKFMPPGVYRVD